MPRCYPGEQCTSRGQKTPSGSSGGPHLPRVHNAVSQWERLHLLHRTVSYHRTADHCSVGSFSGNFKPREPSLKSMKAKVQRRVRPRLAPQRYIPQSPFAPNEKPVYSTFTRSRSPPRLRIKLIETTCAVANLPPGIWRDTTTQSEYEHQSGVDPTRNRISR
jgi:hypothetical protein